jgi:hypothetical protein
LHTLANNHTAAEVAKTLMHQRIEEIGKVSLVEYAKDTSCFYIWTTTLESALGITKESVRFITDAQKKKWGGIHNVILMWNPKAIFFKNNICPYKDRFDHGFEGITHAQCADLGLDLIKLFDENFKTRKDCCKVEEACHYEINDLDLGTQRLHRVPGAGMAHLIGGGGRMLVGATFPPPNFFQNNPNIVIVGSK